jgi:hypothetical protein
MSVFLANPAQTTRVVDALVSPPGSSAIPAEQLGAAIGRRLAAQTTGKMAGLAAEVTSLKLPQAEAVAAVEAGVVGMGF